MFPEVSFSFLHTCLRDCVRDAHLAGMLTPASETKDLTTPDSAFPLLKISLRRGGLSLYKRERERETPTEEVM